MNIRVGFGYDVHAFATERELWLGGVNFDYPHGLMGHSDADVLIHALCDALLGAANLRDIGFHFPDTAADFKNIDSKFLLKDVMCLLREKGWSFGNADCTLVAEQPKMNPRIPDMQLTLAEVMEVESDTISIKASTNEKLGFLGRQEGIVAYATVLIYK